MTPPARDERRWTLYGSSADGKWSVAAACPSPPVPPMMIQFVSVEVMPVAEHEAALAAARPFLGDDQHPDWADYVATNLLDALEQVQDTGDWYGAIREWCKQTRTGRLAPNRPPAAPRQVVEADWHAGYLRGEKAGFESGVAAARQVDDAMVERATEAAWENLRQRTGADYNVALWDGLGQREQDAWRADTRAALLAALTVPEEEGS